MTAASEIKGVCGTESLNRALQNALNPPRPGCRQKVWGSVVFREGDRVMQNRNNYDVIWEKEGVRISCEVRVLE